MSHLTSPAAAASHTASTSRRRWLRFARHFLVMVAAMYAGMLTLYPAYSFLAGRLGYTDPTRDLPVTSGLVMAFAMTAPMVALMAYSRHGWRPVTEMAAAMVIPTLGATLLHLAGTIPAEAVMSVGHLTMIPAMLGVMLARFNHYAEVRHHRRRGGRWDPTEAA
jgi:hypothetical protein